MPYSDSVAKVLNKYYYFVVIYASFNFRGEFVDVSTLGVPNDLKEAFQFIELTFGGDEILYEDYNEGRLESREGFPVRKTLYKCTVQDNLGYTHHIKIDAIHKS